MRKSPTKYSNLVVHDKPLGSGVLFSHRYFPNLSLSFISSPFSPVLCREREGCGGEEGEAVTEEESQTGDQRRQDGEQSLGESTPADFKLLLH